MRVRPALFDAGPDWLDDAAAFVRERVIPLEPLLLSHDYEALRGELAAVRADVKARGWWAPQAPKELGGVGLSLVDFAPVAEVLGVSPLGALAFQAQAPDAGNIELLHEHASDAQRARWLAPLVAGELRSCFAMTEPEHAGSNPVVMSTRAVLEGDEWVIDGHKWFTTAAEGAAFTIVMAVTEPDASKYARASMIIVPLDTPGVERVRNISVMGEAGAGYASHAELRFVGARVPANSLLGGRGQGFLLAQQRLGPGRIHHCMRWIGIAERAHDAMVARAATRDLGGGKPLGTARSSRVGSRHRARDRRRAAARPRRRSPDRRRRVRGARRHLRHQVPRRGRDAPRPRSRHPDPRRARVTVSSSRTSGGTSAPRASTTAPMRYTRWSSRGTPLSAPGWRDLEMAELSDAPGKVRESEALPKEALELDHAHVPGFEGALTIEQFRKGHSNLVLRLRPPPELGAPPRALRQTRRERARYGAGVAHPRSALGRVRQGPGARRILR